ncbi:hypothetical protein GC175_12040 [bacterium]|nr:hypothetical protein [bacterium]
MLTIKTLGKFDILLNGTSLLNGTDIRRGLFLIYLWEKQTPQPRYEVARLLWPWGDHNGALVNLRAFLLRLRKEGLDNYLDADRNTVMLINRENIEYDAAKVRALTQKPAQAEISELATAADLHHGAFLESVILDEYPELDEWVGTVRAEIEVRIVQALSVLVAQGIASGYAEMILGYAEKLVALTPYEDDSQELYLLGLAKSGRISEMLDHFHHYRRRLKEEVNDQPGQKLIDLVERLKAPQVHPAASQIADGLARAEEVLSAEDAIGSGRFFPHIEHPVIGREEETRQLLSKLDGRNRLLSIVGIGGTGKTFFVRCQHKQLQVRFDNAIYHVDLRSAAAHTEQAANMLLLAISDALNLTIQPGIPIFEQVAAILRQSKCCLILDNFETVQSAALLVLELLKSAPKLTVLVTSRERLNLSMESIISLGGLSQQGQQASTEQTATPETPGISSSETENAAVRYFLQCAQRQDIHYTIDDEKRRWIEQICRQVGALPLAIELTAMQLLFYSLQELAAQVSVNQSLLTTDIGDLPDDHYSVWAVLESMWQTLNGDERRVLAELSVFAGAFHRDAMMGVSPAERSTYTRLINASLLRTEEPAWFSLHPLVKQYAARQLKSGTVYERHARYFLNLFNGGLRILQELVAQELSIPPLVLRYQADVMSAWNWAMNHTAWNLLDHALLAFTEYLSLSRQREESIRQMSELLAKLPEAEERDQQLQRLAGRAAFRLASSQPSNVTFWFESSLASLKAAGDPWDIAATALAYAEQVLGGNRITNWGQVESLLALAGELIEQHQLEPLQFALDFVACAYFLREGEWAKLDEMHKAVLKRMARPSFMFVISHNMLYSVFLDNWQQLAQLITRTETDNSDTLAMPHTKHWAAHYQANAMAQSGEITAAIQQRQSILSDYAKVNTQFMLPMAYGELTLWHYRVGDLVAAQETAQEALLHAGQKLNSLATAFGQLFVAAFHYLSGDTAKVGPLLHNVLALGQELHHTTMIFSPLYYLAQIHADKLPAELVQRILKIGAVSPAMHFVLRPLARRHLAAQGIVLADAERESLWATDMTTVQSLTQDVMKVVP